MVVVDSVRAVRDIARREGDYGLRTFTHDLAQVAVVWNTTSLMLGEFEEEELRAGPEFTMADGILWLEMDHAENSVVRKLQVVKSRGMDVIQGRHSFRISSEGLYVYPRIAPTVSALKRPIQGRAGWSLAALDRMLDGGIPRAGVCVIAGPSGCGKSTFCQQWLAAGLAGGETCVAVTFEETSDEYVDRAETFGWPFRQAIEAGRLAMLYFRPMDLTVDQVIDETRKAVTRTGATRLVVDSISGFELARAPADRSDFRETLYRMVSWFRAQGVTVLLATEVPDIFGDVRLTTQEISFVADDIIVLRFIEIESELRRALAVLKMRRSNHERELRQFQITSHGLSIGAPFREYTGLLTGAPSLVAIMGPQPFAPGLADRETVLVGALFSLGTPTLDEIVQESGFQRSDVEAMMRELVGRGYVVREQVDDQDRYHISMVSWMPGIRRPPRSSASPGGGGNRADR
jgi:circadian clock protein KaiC